MPHAPQPSPASRVVAAATALAALVGAQGLALIAAGVFLIVRALEPDAGHRGSTEVLGALSVVVGLGVLAMARAALARRSRVRSPLLVLQMLCLPIAVTVVQGGRWYIGVPLALVAIAVIILMGVSGLLVPRED